MDEFVAEYGAGRTPNPCVRCNSSFRFDALAEFADRVGAARLATGHYARVVTRDGRTLVARAADPTKDQSYMLARVAPEILARTWFPLGEQTKPETREQARAAGLEAAGRAESQEVCFVGGGDHRAFLERYGGAGPAGDVVDEDGEVVGHHDGIHRFTPGQRRGVGVAANTPIYVIRTEPASGRVVVGPRAALERTLVAGQPRRGVRGRRRPCPGQAALPLRPRVGNGRPDVPAVRARARRPGDRDRRGSDGGALPGRRGRRRRHHRVADAVHARVDRWV